MGGRTQSDAVLAELLDAAALSVSAHSPDDLSKIRISSLTADSRCVTAGSCFVAVRGEQTDGHAHIDEALRGGAAAIISEREADVPDGVGAVRVRDARSALSRLAAAFHGFAPGQPYEHMKLTGVTGTNGKTTTCILLRSILAAAGHPTALLGTIRYDLVGETQPAPWTTPPPAELYRCLAQAAGNGATHAVMEVSSHALAQTRCDGHRFAAAVFTNLSGDHLDYHKSMHAYAAAKKRLFDMLDRQALAVVNADDPESEYMLSSCKARQVRFAIETPAQVTAAVESITVGQSRFVLRTPHGDTLVSLPLTGRHNIANALAAAAAALSLGIGLDAVGRGLESVDHIPGRLQRVDSAGRGFNVFVDYAHTDQALTNVLAALRPFSRRLICVFGCGGDRDRSKRPRMAAAVGAWADVAVVTSDNPRWEAPGAIIDEIRAGFTPHHRCQVQVEPDRRRAIQRALDAARPGDTVLVAGKGHEDYQIIRDKRWHFDDVEVVTEALANKEVPA
ncbi:MAG: UDP-N-acetylmuramoyl-L-alanyl-D-glutamate--2,6-diaminopimelate ligase [Phycisphaeraceae bacterium]